MKYLLILFLIFSCSKSNNQTDEPTSVVEKKEVLSDEVEVVNPSEGKESCGFYHDEASKDLKVTGYKFEEKSGVTGTFKKWKLNLSDGEKTLNDYLMSASIVIMEESLEFGKPARNTNILNGLLKKIPGKQIRAVLMAVDEVKKTVMIDINMGGQSHPVEFSYKYENNRIDIEGGFDLLELGFKEAFNSLAKICRPHHMKNGKAKTWSTVDVKIGVNVKNTCS